MSKPTILTVEDDPQVSAAITRDLAGHYGADYRVIGVTSGAEALSVLTRLALRDEPVALIAADQRMPRMTGIELLRHARAHAPGAKFLLLTAYADTDVAIKAINDIGLDYYLLKPWDLPEDRLYPVVDDLLDDWRQAHPDHTSDVRVAGTAGRSGATRSSCSWPATTCPTAGTTSKDPEAQRLLDLARAAPADLPLVLVPEGEALLLAVGAELAGALGLRTSAQQRLYDVCIVGGGPAGLAAAVYAASEGLSTVVLEREAPGGRRDRARRSRTTWGSPRAERRRPHPAGHRPGGQVRRRDGPGARRRRLRGPRAGAGRLDGSGEIEARALVVATGVSYRRLEAQGLDQLTGRGVYYGANAGEASQTQGDDVYVVGAANSAGQAALHLSRFARRVVLVVRAATLADTMSRYLVERITSTPNVTVRYRSEVVSGQATATEALTLADRDTGPPRRCRRAGCSSSSGPRPAPSGSAPTSPATTRGSSSPATTCWRLPGRAVAAPRVPFALETSVPGVFAAGDVRLDSMKRVASAVGEGAMSVHLVHRYLATI